MQVVLFWGLVLLVDKGLGNLGGTLKERTSRREHAINEF